VTPSCKVSTEGATLGGMNHTMLLVNAVDALRENPTVDARRRVADIALDIVPERGSDPGEGAHVRLSGGRIVNLGDVRIGFAGHPSVDNIEVRAEPGFLDIRANHGQVAVEPIAGNVVRVSAPQRWDAAAKARHVASEHGVSDEAALAIIEAYQEIA
jgi:hypothetical protein